MFNFLIYKLFKLENLLNSLSESERKEVYQIKKGDELNPRLFMEHYGISYSLSQPTFSFVSKIENEVATVITVHQDRLASSMTYTQKFNVNDLTLKSSSIVWRLFKLKVKRMLTKTNAVC